MRMPACAERRGIRAALACVPLLSALTAGAVPSLPEPTRAQPVSVQTADPEYLIDRWEVDEGLPENSANAMVQDREGYLWFGTFQGLVRFDGWCFRVFTPDNTPGLAGAQIVNLHMDRSGRLWVSTYSGLSVRTGQHWETRPESEAWAGKPVRSFAERANGDLLFTTFDGRIAEFIGDRMRLLPSPEGAEPGQGFQGAVDESGRWWVVQRGMLVQWDGQAWKSPQSPQLGSKQNITCAQSRDGGIWILADNQLRKVRGGVEVVSLQVPRPLGGHWSLFEDTAGQLWVSSYNAGVTRIGPGGELRTWKSGQGLAYDGVRFVFEDREGAMWIGSSGGGLSRFRPRRMQTFGPSAGILEPVVTSVCPDPRGGTWVATYGRGVFLLQDGKARQIPVWAPNRPDAYVQSVLVDSRGRTWIGTFDDGLCIIDGEARTRIDPCQTCGGNVIALFEDSRRRVWAAGGGGVAACEQDEFRQFSQAQGLPAGGYAAFGEDAAGTIFTASSRGLYRLEGHRFVEVHDQDGRPIAQTACMSATPDGALWIGQRSGCLARLKGGQVSIVGAEHGLPEDGVLSIVEDAAGYWWMSSGRGIIRALGEDLARAADGDAQPVRFQRFDRSDGMASAECTGGRQPVAALDASGELWFATSRGVVRVDPRRLRINDAPPGLIIEEASFASRSDVPGAVRRVEISAPAGGIVIPPGGADLEIRYAGLSFVIPEKVRFQTQLLAAEQDWRAAGQQRSARYFQLGPGEYRFRVRAANNDGAWSEPLEVPVTVLPFFWQTGWFRTGSVAALVVACSLLVWGLTRAQARRQREQLDLASQRNELVHLTRVHMMGELSGSLAHELKQPITAILTNAQAALRFLSREPADLGEVREILADIVGEDRRAGEIIHRLRLLLKKGEVRPQCVEVPGLVEDVLKLVHSDLVSRNITVRVSVPDAIPPICSDRVQAQQILLNLITNACDAVETLADRGDDRSVLAVAAAAHTGRFVRFSVVDRGPGIAAGDLERVFEPFFTTKNSGMGLGLSMCRTIVSAHGGQIWAENNADAGATIHFTMPVHEIGTGEAELP